MDLRNWSEMKQEADLEPGRAQIVEKLPRRVRRNTPIPRTIAFRFGAIRFEGSRSNPRYIRVIRVPRIPVVPIPTASFPVA